MTRKALIEREKKRDRLREKYQAKRQALKEIINDLRKNDEERYLARLELQKLPRNSNPTRHRNRCLLTGRPRGTLRRFGLSRHKFREMAFMGQIPGVVKDNC